MLYKCFVFAGMYVHVRYIVARQTRYCVVLMLGQRRKLCSNIRPICNYHLLQRVIYPVAVYINIVILDKPVECDMLDILTINLKVFL